MQQQEPKSTSTKKRIQIFSITIIVLALLCYAGTTIHHAMTYESTDNAQIESNAIPVLSRVSGYINVFELNDYQSVKAGQLLITIDDKEYKLAVQQASADLAVAKADLTNAQEQLNNLGSDKNVASAGVGVEQVNREKAALDLKRDQALYNEGSITEHQLDNSKAASEVAKKQLASSKTRVLQVSTQSGTANAQIQRAIANVAIREAALEKAKLQLSYTQITAPSMGKVGKTNLQKGQYVQPGQQLFSIISNEQYWIVANFKETQIEHMRLGQPVHIEVDGYPDQEITGKIVDFSNATGAKFSLLPPDNSTGNFVKVTQRVPVKIAFDNQANIKQLLKAGLSVNVAVKVN